MHGSSSPWYNLNLSVLTLHLEVCRFHMLWGTKYTKYAKIVRQFTLERYIYLESLLRMKNTINIADLTWDYKLAWINLAFSFAVLLEYITTTSITTQNMHGRSLWKWLQTVNYTTIQYGSIFVELHVHGKYIVCIKIKFLINMIFCLIAAGCT